MLEGSLTDRKMEVAVDAKCAELEAMQGRFELARELVARATGLAQEFGDQISLSRTLLDSARVEMLADSPETAERDARAGYEILERIKSTGNLASAAPHLGDFLYAQGRYDEAEKLSEFSERITIEGDVDAEVRWRQLRAKTLARRGQHDEAEALAEGGGSHRRSDRLSGPACRCLVRPRGGDAAGGSELGCRRSAPGCSRSVPPEREPGRSGARRVVARRARPLKLARGRGETSAGQDQVELQPAGEVLQLAAHRGGRGRVERLVLVDRIDPEHAGLAVRGGVDLADQPVAVQHRERVVAPSALGRGLVHLELVVEVEQLEGALAVVDEPVERRQQRGAPRERTTQQRRVDAPLAFHAVDDGGLTHLAHIPRFHRALQRAGSGDAERAEPPLVARALRLLEGDDRTVGVDARREVPQPLRSLPARDRDLAPRHHEVEHLLDVAVVGPPGRPPGLRAGIRQLAHRQRAGGLQPLQDVPSAGVVGLDPVAALHLPGSERSRARPGRHVGAVEREVFGGPDQRLQLDERPVREGAPQLCRVVRRAEAAPHDQVGARRDRGDRVQLEEAQVSHQFEQSGRSFGVEHLGLHGDPARVGPGQLVDGGHAPRLSLEHVAQAFEVPPVRAPHRRRHRSRADLGEPRRRAAVTERHPRAAVRRVLPRVRGLHREWALLGAHHEPLAGDERRHFVGVGEAASQESRHERQPRPDRQRWR